jgi:putative sterol carrier protein
VEFRFTDDEHGRYWLVLDAADVSVCLDPPPFEVDVWVECTMTTFYRVWLGRTDYQQALAQRQLDVRGDPSLERAFPSWFAWSPAAPWVRAASRP